MEIQVPIDYLLVTPAAGGILYLFLRNIGWFWTNKSPIAKTLCVLLCAGGGITFIAKSVYEHRQTTMHENLPGKWYSLYYEMDACEYSEAKMLIFENFCAKEAATEPQLTPLGFDKFCDLVTGCRCNGDETKRRTQRLAESAKEFVYFSENPDFVLVLQGGK